MWTEEEKELLVLVLDELIPPGNDGEVPGAGTIGVADFFAQAGDYAEDPINCIRAVLESIKSKSAGFGSLERDARVALMQEVESEHTESFATLVRLTYMGYYSRAETRPLFGVGAHPVHPVGYTVAREDDALMDKLSAPVRARGSCYRN